ncbi:hypothetical protein IV203_030039 [Nitzschia inconspicua]|uniref:Uncharacterized protein n=1 Tax=Nitzschia inconspicua TaxID=303405 RepID=A0A9K3LST7_9STRA|nr:hypothetical protein IV203_030039 [Nitzschia inconspicua]
MADPEMSKMTRRTSSSSSSSSSKTTTTTTSTTTIINVELDRTSHHHPRIVSLRRKRPGAEQYRSPLSSSVTFSWRYYGRLWVVILSCYCCCCCHHTANANQSSPAVSGSDRRQPFLPITQISNDAVSLSRLLHMSRGGGDGTRDNNHNTGKDTLSDEDIDEYIEFLLAYAEDRAIEADNPLFKKDSVSKEEEEEEEEDLLLQQDDMESSSSLDEGLDVDSGLLQFDVVDMEVIQPSGITDFQAVDESHENKTVHLETPSPVDITVENVMDNENEVNEEVHEKDFVDVAAAQTDATLTDTDVENLMDDEKQGKEDGHEKDFASQTVATITDADVENIMKDEEEVKEEVHEKDSVEVASQTDATLTDTDVENFMDDEKQGKEEVHEKDSVDVAASQTVASTTDTDVELTIITDSSGVTEDNGLETDASANKEINADEDGLKDDDSLSVGEELSKVKAEEKDAGTSVNNKSEHEYLQIASEEWTIMLGNGIDDLLEAKVETVVDAREEGEPPALSTMAEDALISKEGHLDEEGSFVDSIMDKVHEEDSFAEQSLPSHEVPKDHQAEKPVADEAEQSKTGSEIPDERQGDASKVKGQLQFSQYYGNLVAMVRAFWNRPRKAMDDTGYTTSSIPSRKEPRDYTKVYKKYFSAPQTTNGHHQVETNSVVIRQKNGFARPWGTVMNFFHRKRSTGGEDLAMSPETENEKKIIEKPAPTITESPNLLSEETPTFLHSLNPNFAEEMEEIVDVLESEEVREEGETLVENEALEQEIPVLSELQEVEIMDTEEEEEPTIFSTPVTSVEQIEETEVDVDLKTNDMEEDIAVIEHDELCDSENDQVELIMMEDADVEIDDFAVEEISSNETETMFDTVDPIDYDILDDGRVVEEMDNTSMDRDDDVQQLHTEAEPRFEVETIDPLDPANVVWRFLIAKGFETAVMVAVLIIEWFRLYVFEPLAESAEKLSYIAIRYGLRTGSILHSKLLKTRGGHTGANENGDSEIYAGTTEEEKEAEISSDSKDFPANEVDGDDSSSPDVACQPEVTVDGNDVPRSYTQRNSKIEAQMSVPRIRPNRLYRFLLGYGYLGHVVIMDCILAVEWLQLYVPFVPHLVTYVMFDVLKIQRSSSRVKGESAILRTSGFLGADGTSVRAGKKKKAQTKKEDLRALDQLKRLGDVNQARYMFLSQSFMKRHSLGPYAGSSKGGKGFQLEVDRVRDDSRESVDEEMMESDSEWIVQALTNEEEEEAELLAPPIETDLGLSFGSEGPKVTIGVGFSIGETPRRRNKKRSSSISSIVRQSQAPIKKKKTSGPRVSDRESGVIGRLRAAGANSLMGRNLLGAYPGDLPPPHEAADSNGLYELAERYGYGDWSDNDYSDDGAANAYDNDDADDDSDGNEDDALGLAPGDFQTKSSKNERKKSSASMPSKKKKRRRKSSSSSSQGIELGFRFGDGDSSPPLSKRRLPRNVSQRSPNSRPKSRSRNPPKAMELLGKPSLPVKKTSSNETGISNSFKSKRVRPAMSLLDEIRNKDE